MAEKKYDKCNSCCPPASPAWMTTYGDMTTLLLTFFILMFTTAEVDGQELRLILSSFTGSFGIQQGGLSLSKGPLAEFGQTIETLPSTTQGARLSEAIQEARSLFEPEQKADQVKVLENERGLMITLFGDAFFEPGSATIREDMKETLNKVGRFITSIKARGLDNKVAVEGHTDNRPIEPGTEVHQRFESNWELSGARAINIVQYFTLDLGMPPTRKKGQDTLPKFSAVGWGEYKPVASNDTPEGRGENRRVDIIIERK